MGKTDRSFPSIFTIPEGSHDYLHSKLDQSLGLFNVPWFFAPTSTSQESNRTDGAEKGPVGNTNIDPRRRSLSSSSSSCVVWWSDFAHRTTFHGFRFVWKEQAGSIRRLLWLLLLLASAAMMGCQIVDRVFYYYGYPVSVNVNVRFNSTLLFPSITMCNLNAFRASRAAALNRYGLLEAMFNKGSKVMGASFLQRHNASDITLDDLFLSVAHDKHDFIVDCSWRHEQCGPDNFTRVLTDHGVCFTFTPLRPSPLSVSSPGSGSGLSLTLNAEQYEYMPGPHDAGGIKVLLHDEHEVPKVAELGLAIPTGTYTDVGIRLTIIENLPPPHGSCGSVVSPHYEDTWYTRDKCQLSCLTDLMANACGCRDHYMPHTNGSPPVCTLSQYYECYLEKIDDLRKSLQDSCPCPVPCSYRIYDPVIALSCTSAFATDRLQVSAAHSRGLPLSYLRALETTERLEEHKFHSFMLLERETSKTLAVLTRSLLHDVASTLRRAVDALTEAHREMEAAWRHKLHLSQWEEYNAQKNFVRVWDAMSERTFDFLAMGYQELATLTESRIRLFLSPNMTSPKIRQSLYVLVMTSLKAKVDLAERTLANYSQLVTIYTEGTPLFNYTFLDETLEDNVHITPKPLFRRAMNHSALARQYCPKLREDIVNFTWALEGLVGLVSDAYENRLVHEDDIHFATVNFLVRGQYYYYSKSVFSEECINYPVGVLVHRRQMFERTWPRYDDAVQGSLDDIRNLQDSLNTLEATILQDLNTALARAERYIHGDEDVRKIDIARQLTSQSILVGKAKLEVFFDTLRSHGRNIYDNWQKIADETISIWELIINDEDTHHYYVYKNLTSFLRNVTDVRREVAEEYMDYGQRFDVQDIIGNADSRFMASLDVLVEHLHAYLDRTVISGGVIKENLVQLNIYPRENHYEHITQRVAYDGFALVCNIGGSMGLFMGASLLSVGELVDLIFRYIFQRFL